MAGALEGIVVLDHTMWQAGPAAGAILADLGADVLKIEEPRSGDVGRYLRVGTDDFTLGEDHSYYFEMYNRGKRGVALDLKKPSEREAFYRLVQRADIYLTNLQLDSLTLLGCDYSTLHRVNPRLIYASNTGYGAKGPKAGLPLMDLGAQAWGGLLSVSGYGDDPQNIGGGVADQSGGLMLAAGVFVALYHRERTGQGQRVDTSILGTQAWLGHFILQRYLFDGYLPQRAKLHELGGNPMYNQYKAGDGRWIMLSSVRYDPYWESFCKVIEREDLLTDARFDSPQGRLDNAKELLRILEDVFITRPAREWIDRFASCEFGYGLVRRFDEVAADEQLRENGVILPYEDEVVGRTRRVVFPVGLSETPVSLKSSAPALGQHTEECLMELAGYDWEAIERMRSGENGAGNGKRRHGMSHTVTDGKKTLEIHAENCVGCFLCQMACSFTKEKVFNRDQARITVQRDGPWEDTWATSFTEDCDACGYCVSFCEYEALSLKRLAPVK